MAFETSEEYLKYYYEKYGNFRVQFYLGRPLKWVNYGTKEYDEYAKDISPEVVNNRERMPDEIIFDIEAPKQKGDLFDAKRKKVTFETAKEIAERLKKVWKLSYAMFWSGGKGIHCHQFYSELTQYNKYDRKLLKQILLKKIGYGYLEYVKDGSKGKLDLQDTPWIQLECAKHRKGGVKTLIEENYIGNNLIPKIVMDEFNEIKKKQASYKPEEFKTGEVPSCIKYLEYEDFRNLEDGRHRACFILAAYYSNNTDINKTNLFEKLKKWNYEICRGHLNDSYIKSQVDQVFKHKESGGRIMGCNYRKSFLTDLGMRKLCIGCHFEKRRLESKKENEDK